jgi:hypothetical protein
MKFRYDWDEPLLAEACHELEIRQIKEQYWREARRSASLAVALMMPLLVAVLVASFEYLTRRQVHDGWSVLAVCLLGGLLGGVLVCLRGLAQRARIRLAPEQWPEGVTLLLVPPLLTGAAAGTASGFGVMTFVGHDSYRPQTLYLIALACAFALSRFTAVRFTAVEVVDVPEDPARIGSSSGGGQAQ